MQQDPNPFRQSQKYTITDLEDTEEYRAFETKSLEEQASEVTSNLLWNK